MFSKGKESEDNLLEVAGRFPMMLDYVVRLSVRWRL